MVMMIMMMIIMMIIMKTQRAIQKVDIARLVYKDNLVAPIKIGLDGTWAKRGFRSLFGCS